MTNDKVALILAGGQSLRMGTDKAYLTLQGNTLLNIMQTIIRPLVQHVYISSNKEQNAICDTHSLRGPIAGIESFYQRSLYPKPLLLIVPVDMPMLKPQMLTQLMDTVHNRSLMAAYINDSPLPCCLYVSSNFVLSIIQKMYQSSQYALKIFLSKLQAYSIKDNQFDGNSINTLVQWKTYKILNKTEKDI